MRRDFCSFFPHTYTSSFHWSLNYSILFSYQFWIFTALQQCWGRSISRWFIIVEFIVGIDMAVDVMQSATFELNISDSLHNAQTNTAIAFESEEGIQIREW